MEAPRLYGYFRSSAAYRVRIALNLKGLTAEHAFVHLRKGEQRGEAHRAVNSAGLVPVWRESDGFTSVSRSPSSTISMKRIPSRRCCRPIRVIALTRARLR